MSYANWDEALLLLPEHMRSGVILYIEDGIPPGGFLEAVMANDFLRACQMADHVNQAFLPNWGQFLHYCPNQCYGSYRNVRLWIKSGGLNGQKVASAAERPTEV